MRIDLARRVNFLSHGGAKLGDLDELWVEVRPRSAQGGRPWRMIFKSNAFLLRRQPHDVCLKESSVHANTSLQGRLAKLELQRKLYLIA